MKSKLIVILSIIFLFNLVPLYAGYYATSIIDAIENQKAMKESVAVVSSDTGGFWAGLKNKVSNVGSSIKNGASSLWDKAKNAVSDAWTATKNKARSVVDGATAIAKDTYNYAVDKGSKFVKGLNVAKITDPSKFSLVKGMSRAVYDKTYQLFKNKVMGEKTDVQKEKEAALAELAELAKHPIELDRPIVLVHGWMSDETTWDGEGENSMKYWLSQIYSNADEKVKYINTTGGDNIDDTGVREKEQIEQIKQELGADKVDIITHSMGGLSTRSAIQNHGMTGVGHVFNIDSPLTGTEEGGIISGGGAVNSIANAAGQIFPSFGKWWNKDKVSEDGVKNDSWHNVMGKGKELDHDSDFIKGLDTPEGVAKYGETVEAVDNFYMTSDPVVSEVSAHANLGPNTTNHSMDDNEWVSHTAAQNDPRVILSIVKQLQAEQATRNGN